jgi:hypothetical protein
MQRHLLNSRNRYEKLAAGAGSSSVATTRAKSREAR